MRWTNLILLFLLLLVTLSSSAIVDENDHWKPCVIDAFGEVTCDFIEKTTRRGGEAYVEFLGCVKTKAAAPKKYRIRCKLRSEYLLHAIKE